jgi:hypothetical protein
MTTEERLTQHIELLNERMNSERIKSYKQQMIIDKAKHSLSHFKKCTNYRSTNGLEWITDFERELGEQL